MTKMTKDLDNICVEEIFNETDYLTSDMTDFIDLKTCILGLK